MSQWHCEVWWRQWVGESRYLPGGRYCRANEINLTKGNMLVIKRIVAVGALGSVGFLGLSALPAGAATHLGPNVNLKVKSDVLKFKPGTLNLTLGKGKKCTATNYAFSITNKTGSTEEIDDGGSPFFSMAPGQENFLCTGVGTSTFSVDGTSATLTVNMSS
jgi:hypothetical protein